MIRAAARGRDPQREKREKRKVLTVGEVCDSYLEAARNGMVITRFGPPKKLSTIAVDEGLVARHINPLIGRLPADELTRADAKQMAADEGCADATIAASSAMPNAK